MRLHLHDQCVRRHGALALLKYEHGVDVQLQQFRLGDGQPKNPADDPGQGPDVARFAAPGPGQEGITLEPADHVQRPREIEIALPKELNREKQIELVREYVKENFVKVGMCVDIALHDKNDGNPHAHILLTMRPLNEDKTWGAKSKKEYIFDENGEKVKLKTDQHCQIGITNIKGRYVADRRRL